MEWGRVLQEDGGRDGDDDGDGETKVAGRAEDDSKWEASVVLNRLREIQSRGAGVSSGGGSGSGSGFDSPRPVPWLDRLTEQRCLDALSEPVDDEAAFFAERAAGVETEPPAYLIVELPSVVDGVVVVHEETCYPPPVHGASGAVTALDLSLYRRRVQLAKKKRGADVAASNSRPSVRGGGGQEAGGSVSALPPPPELGKDPYNTDAWGLPLVQILDPESEDSNPSEDKYRTLQHDLLRGLVDPALKPDRSQRARLNTIISSPGLHPTMEERDLLWRFRFSLVDNRRALTKFLLAVDWTVEGEVVQAAELLEQWRRRSPIEVTDALKLLGRNVAFRTDLVRQYAIDTLANSTDVELRLYLLQLVQAIKYEADEEAVPPARPQQQPSREANPGPVKMSGVSSLAGFLINRSSKNIELASYLYWYLKVGHFNMMVFPTLGKGALAHYSYCVFVNTPFLHPFPLPYLSLYLFCCDLFLC